MLLHSVGKQITEEAVISVLNAAGFQADEVRVKALVAAISEVNIDEALKTPVITASATVATFAPATKAEEKPTAAAPKKEEKKEEDLQGLGALFG